MITLRTLLGGVLGIIFLSGVSYAMIAPRFQNTVEEQGDVSVTTEDSRESSDDGVYEEEDDDEGEERDDDTASTEADTKITTSQPIENPTSVLTTPVVSTPAPNVEKTYTLAQIATHSTKSSCWTTINGNVYDITSYISRHPGGERNIMKVCGKDGSSLFEGQHGGDSKPESRLASLYIGKLQ